LPDPLRVAVARGLQAGWLVVEGTCRNGHPQSPANVYMWSGKPYCRPCRKSYMALYEQGGRRPYRPTHCPHRHRYDEENISWEGNRRHCKTCKKHWGHQTRRKHHARTQ
jgi:hypothetical protein